MHLIGLLQLDTYCIATSRMVLLQLYDRHSRRPLSQDDTIWQAQGVDWQMFKQNVHPPSLPLSLCMCDCSSMCESTAMWCDVCVWASALQPHTHTITHSQTHTHSLSLVLVVMMKSKGLKTKISHTHSLILSVHVRLFFYVCVTLPQTSRVF